LHGGPGVDYRALISEFGSENASGYLNERTYTDGGLSKLSDSFFCVFYDQKGSGLSPRYDKDQLSFPILVEELDQVVNYFLQQKYNETGILDTKVILVGHSFGGVLATAYTNSYPQKVKDVITYEPGPFTKESQDLLDFSLPFAMIGQDKLDELLMSLKHVTDDSHARADYQRALGANRFQPEFHENENFPFWRLGAYVNSKVEYSTIFEGKSTVDNLGVFKGRFLIIYGSLTIIDLSYDYILKQASYYPDSKIIEISNTGHSGVWEKSDKVLEEIRSFLNN
jgi:proline iminopeptidase